jgi:SWI/SNF-related matrix-associated actin-dependent regulator of chromatin subfamily B protein 1
MRDTFVWNLNGKLSSTPSNTQNTHTLADPIVTPAAFAQSMVEDYALAPSYHSVIIKTIQDKLSDFKAYSANYDGESEGDELLSPSPSTDYNNNIQDPIRGLLRLVTKLNNIHELPDIRGVPGTLLIIIVLLAFEN